MKVTKCMFDMRRPLGEKKVGDGTFDVRDGGRSEVHLAIECGDVSLLFALHPAEAVAYGAYLTALGKEKAPED